MVEGPSLQIDRLQDRYRNGETTPVDVARVARERAIADDHNAWLTVVDGADLRDRAERVARLDQDDHPLYGVPFAVKDNVDVEGMETTAGCPAYAYEADADATVVARLRAAGAMLVGKTNLDQFATGLVGTRSPYGACHNAHVPSYIAGGSSSGSAVAVALDQVSCALGTDTAGSGRVPAALNGVVGYKPTRGLLSTAGVVPACRTLDCVSTFARTCTEAFRVASVAAGSDDRDPFSRRDADDVSLSLPETVDAGVVGVPGEEYLEFFGNDAAASAFESALSHLRTMGWEVTTVDYAPFREAAELLYGGPWVAERLTVVEDLLDDDESALLDVTRNVITQGRRYDATDAFEAMYDLAALQKRADDVLDGVDCLVTPTVGTAYTIDAVRDDPLTTNTNLGYYTNHVNLLDMAAVAVPTDVLDSGVPFGVTLSAEADSDAFLGAVGREFEEVAPTDAGRRTP